MDFANDEEIENFLSDLRLSINSARKAGMLSHFRIMIDFKDEHPGIQYIIGLGSFAETMFAQDKAIREESSKEISNG